MNATNSEFKFEHYFSILNIVIFHSPILLNCKDKGYLVNASSSIVILVIYTDPFIGAHYNNPQVQHIKLQLSKIYF